MGGLVPAVREASGDRKVVKAMARRFGLMSWTALVVLVLTGVVLVLIDLAWSTVLAVKVGLVVIVAGLAAWHSVAGPSQSSRSRGIVQGVILMLSLVILGLALAL